MCASTDNQETNSLKSAQDQLLSAQIAKFSNGKKVKKPKKNKAQVKDTLARAISISNILGDEEETEQPSLTQALDDYLDQLAEAQTFEVVSTPVQTAKEMGNLNSTEDLADNEELCEVLGLDSMEDFGINEEAALDISTVNQHPSNLQHPQEEAPSPAPPAQPAPNTSNSQQPQPSSTPSGSSIAPETGADNNMSTKSISKDRSASRGRDKKRRDEGKKDRFDKARGNPEEEDMEQDSPNAEGKQREEKGKGKESKHGKR